MSLIKNLEIDTLRLRNLQVRDSQNNPILSGFHIYATGDGTTYWSTGVNAHQFIDLSTTVTKIDSTLTNYNSTITSTIIVIASSIAATFYSTIYSLSSFINILTTYSINTAYTDAALSQYSSYVGHDLITHYQTIQSSLTLYRMSYDTIMSSYNVIYVDIHKLSSSIYSTNLLIASNSTITTSTIFGKLSSYTVSTCNGYSTINGLQYTTLEKLIEANIAYTQSTFNIIASSQVALLSTIIYVDTTQLSSFYTTSTLISKTVSSCYQSSVIYTNVSISTLYISTTNQIAITRSTIENKLVSSISSILISRNIIVSSIISSIQQVSTQNASTINYFNDSINLLLSTGLTQAIYKTFIDLQGYSASTIFATESTSNYIVYSTTTSLEAQSISSYNAVINSTFIWAKESLYKSTISTVIPAINSTINFLMYSSLTYFNTTITTITQTYTDNSRALYYNYEQDLISTSISYENNISSQIGVGISIQTEILSTSVLINQAIINNAISTYIYELSSFTYSQFQTAPSIIMNSVNNISTLTNVFNDTGLSSITAGILNIDATKYNNFYVLVSDIGANVYYGLTISTSIAKINQDFTIQIDIPSSYSNRYVTLDTTNLTSWLSTSKIYNPTSYNFTPNMSISNPIPKPDTIQQIYLSTFVGAYIIDMKYTPRGMFIRNIQSYPYIYSRVSFTGPLVFSSNVQVSNTNLAHSSTFVYRGTAINVSWTTNDLNIPLGVKFTGVDLYGKPITSWAGPYPSGAGSAIVKIPTAATFLVRYDTMYLGVYPNTTKLDNTMAGNAQTPTFSSRSIPSSIHVVNPTTNTYIRVINPGMYKFLQITEINVNNDAHQNIVLVSTNTEFTIDTVDVNVNVFPFNGSYESFGGQNAFDGNFSTYFYGGYTSGEVNLNAYIGGKFKAISSLTQQQQQQQQQQEQSKVLISSIDIYAGPTYDIQNMQLIMSNYNEPGIVNGLFYSTIILTSDSIQSYSFS